MEKAESEFKTKKDKPESDDTKDQENDKEEDEDEIEVVLVKNTKKHNHYSVFGTDFIVDKRYEIVEPAGSGAYGTVVIANDKKRKNEEDEYNKVAI